MAIVSAVIFASVGVAYAAAARRGLSMIPFVAIASSTAGIMAAAFTLRWDLLFLWREQILLGAWVGIAGIFGQLGMVFTGQAMKISPRRKASAWTFFQMAMVVPFLIATLTRREQAQWYQWIAMPAVLVALAALAPKRPSGTEAAVDGRSGDSHSRWLCFVVAAFLCGGMCQTLVQEMSLRDMQDPLDLRAPAALAAAGVFLWSITILKRERVSASHWRFGAGTGVIVAMGNVSAFKALDMLREVERTCLFYPIAVGGSMVLFASFQLITRRESLSPRKLLGLACGLAGVILLALKGLLALAGR